MAFISQVICQPSIHSSDITVRYGDTDRKKLERNNNMCSMSVSGKCPFCDWVCKSMKASTFAMHLSRKHSLELGRQPKPYKCDECDKHFDARSHLNHHHLNHHEIIFHNCKDTSCSYKGKNKASLITHYVNKHMKDIKKRCDVYGRCITCNKEDPGPYHIGRCHPSSPFSEKKTVIN